MSLVYQAQVAGPATHAIVIGVGAYTYLPGGGGAHEFAQHGGMVQLSSPPQSARTFATWLIEQYHNPDKPLASLELLLSDSSSQDFVVPGGGVIPVERANLDCIDEAVLHWKDRGDTNRDHQMVFFFCGHGVNKGLQTTLLLEDFGERSDRPLRQAIDLNQFYLGMDKCAARYQCYFIDACRVASPLLIGADGYAGEPIIYGSASFSPEGRRFAPIYYATIAGDRAYGRDDAPSVFTEALLHALAGAGSDDVYGDWRVDTDTLHRGISFLVKRALSSIEWLDQVSAVDELTTYTLHYLGGKPVVPVAIGCQPDEANEHARLSYADPDGTNEVVRAAMEPSEWDVLIEEGCYRFAARFPGGIYQDSDRVSPVRPPFRPIPIEVSS